MLLWPKLNETHIWTFFVLLPTLAALTQCSSMSCSSLCMKTKLRKVRLREFTFGVIARQRGNQKGGLDWLIATFESDRTASGCS